MAIRCSPLLAPRCHGHPEWGAFRVDRIDPRLSTAKALATLALAYDGRNDITGGLTLKALLAKLRKSDRFRPVRIVLIAYGTEADVPALRKIAAATGGAVFEAPNPAEIDRVFAAAIASS